MKRCLACGNDSPDQFRYCGYCGAPLAPAPADEAAGLARRPAAGEGPALARDESARRLITVLFADLTNYTRTASRVDPEEIYHTVRELFERLARSIRRHGGYIDRYVGDGFLAAFGLPEVHEDDPVRALRAALEMQQTISDLSSKASQNLDWELELRVGINTGQVIQGQIDTGSLLDTSVFGHTVNLANRLQEAARPGTILASEEVYRCTRAQFDFGEPVRLQLRGIDKPVIGYELVGQRQDPQPSRGLIGRRTELVGRRDEFETLLGGLLRLKVDPAGPAGMVALVTGLAGIGKTRLVDDVLAQLAGRFALIRTACTPTEVSSYGLLADVLANLAGIAPDDPGPVRQQRVDDLLATAGSLAGEVRPVLYDLVGAPGDGRQAADDPQQRQRRILVAVRRLLAWLARRQVLVLVLDDLQWADPSSLSVLAHVADLVSEVPLALVAIARSVAHGDLRATFDRLGPTAFRDIPLQPLSPEESELLLTLLLSRVALPPELRRSIVDRSGGNPLLIEELVRMLLDQGVVRLEADGWQIEDRWVEVVQKVPDTVNGLILGRYDRLPGPLKRLLAQAAVLGQSFSLPLLVAMTGLPEPELRQQLRGLEEADFVRRSAGGGVPVYLFRHALMQEAVYETLLQRESKALHLRAAEVIRQMSDDLAVDSVALIGHHLEKANSPQAFSYLLRAAGRAADRYANQEAIACYRRARALLDPAQPETGPAIDVALGLAELLARVNQLDQAGETLAQARDLSAGGYRQGDILYHLGRVQARQGDHAAALTAFEEAAGLLRAAPADGHGFSLADIEHEVGWVMCRQGKLVEAQTHAEEALALAQQQADLGAVANAYNLLTPVHYWAGRLPAAVTSAREALAIREQIGDVWGAASTQTNLAVLYHRLGQWDQAESLLRQAIFVRQEIGDHQGVVQSSNILGLLLLESGRLDEAMDWLEQAVAGLQKQAVISPDLASQIYGNRGLLWLRLGEPESARSDLETCRRYADQAGNDDLRALALAYLAEAELAGGDLAQSESLLAASGALCGPDGSPEIRAEQLRVRSLWHRAQDDWPAALEANRQALALYRELGNQYEVAHLQLEAAEIQLVWHDRSAVETQDRASLHFGADVREGVLEALRILRELSAQALIPPAEELLSRVTACWERVAGRELAVEQLPVVLVHARLRVPDEARGWPEAFSPALERIKTELRRLGRQQGARVSLERTGVVYLFGEAEPAPTGRLAERAIQAARAALDTAIRLNRISQRQHDLQVPVTIGIASGQSGGPGDVHPLPPSQVQAARQAAALAATPLDNAIVLAGEIASVAHEAYELELVESRAARLKDTDGPDVSCYRLGRPRAESGVPQALPGAALRLVGRDAEIRALGGWVDRLRTGEHGLVCYLEAQAGMGKTRLVEELLAYAQPAVRCLLGKCESFRSNISYWPLIDMLEQGRFPDTPSSRQLKGLLALRPPDDADDVLLRSVAPADLRQELFGRVRAFLLDQAQEQPLLLVLEDIHCIDLSSLDLIDFMLPLTFQAPISLLLVARAEMPGPHRALVSRAERVCRDRYLRLSLGPLDEEASLALVCELLGTDALPEPLWEMVRPFSGHPLSLEEALRFLVERGWLWRSNGRWRMIGAEGEQERTMPATFKDLVLGRLDALDKETLHVFQAAAVLGEFFDRGVLGRIVPQPGLSRRLAELVARGWLLAPAPDQPHLYRFKHTLTRETIYATVLTSKRQVLHQRAGEAIRALYPEAEEEHVELLAHHFSQSSLREESLHYLVRAADKSSARYALAESLEYYTKADELLALMPDWKSRLLPRVALGLADVHLLRGEPASAASRAMPLLEAADPALPVDLRAAVLRRLAEARREMGDHAAALTHYEAARAALAEAAWLDPALDHERWTIELGLAQTLFDMRENRRARQQAEGTLEALDRQAHPRLAAEALSLLGGMAYRQGDLAAAAHLVQDSLSIHQRIGNRGGAAAAYANLGILAAGQDPDAARHDFSLGLQIYQALGDGRGIAIGHNNLGQLERNLGRLPQAIGHLEQAIEAARRAELTGVLAQSLANLGQALTLTGATEKALSALDEAESLCERYGLRNLLCEVAWKRADCLSERGELAAAERAALTARALARELGSRDLQSEAERALARAYRLTDRPAQALELAAAAWQARSGHPDPAVRARFAADYALALLASQQRDQARQLMQEQVAPVALYESPGLMQAVSQALTWLGLAPAAD